MTSLEHILEPIRTALSSTFSSLASSKVSSIDALRLCDEFISSATLEAAYGDSYAFFGRMRGAGEALPQPFEGIDEDRGIKGPDRRLQPYIRSQLFIALVAEVEDFLSQLLMAVFRAYPQKLQDQSVKINQILELGSIEAAIDNAATNELTKMFYASPEDYRKRIEEILSMGTQVLGPVWPSYAEMKARRDVGLHNNWQQDDRYRRKVSVAGATIPSTDFLGVDRDYFSEALDVAKAVVEICTSHCTEKFRGKTENHDMGAV